MAPPPPLDRTETLSPRASSPEPAPLPVPTTAALVDDPERYEPIAEHARGGLGRVVRAVDKRLGRTVAVKELLRRNDATNEARFMREALITARLEHPGIVPVHEAGRWPTGEPYYVMKLVEGRTLKEVIAEHHVLRERLALLPHVIAVADAVGYAHSEGVIHRDLKPSNVVIGEFGETIVVDWGLARDRKHPVDDALAGGALGGSSSGVSIAGKVIGTPAYMAPEQARGELVDERADVYAIGALLYEVLAGVAPHAEATPQATLDRVLAGPPRPLSETVPAVPGELATIVGKAMARDPGARYATATALAEDLRRFQTGKLVRAHSYTALSRLRKKLSQHRGVAAVAVASAVALGAVGVTSVRRVVAERNIARVERQRTEDALATTEQRKRALLLLQAETSLRKDPTAALAWLKLALASPGRDHLQPWSEGDRAKIVDVVDEAVALGVARHVFRPGDRVYDAMFSSDGSRLIAAVRDGTLRSYELRTGIETTLGHTGAPLELLVMTSDGKLAITGSQMGEVMAWPVTGGAPRRLAAIGHMIKKLRLSPDDRRLRIDGEAGTPMIVALDDPMASPTPCGPPTTLKVAVADDDWTKQVVMTAWNQLATVHEGRTTPLGQVDKAIAHVGLSPRGEVVVAHDGVTLWTVPFAGGAMRPIAKYEGKLVEIEWSPDQRTFAAIGALADILLVDVATGASRELRGHSDAIYNVQWSRDGRRLLSGSDDGTARVWTIGDGSSVVMRGHDDDVYRARFSADERQVATASLDSTVRVWPLDTPGTRVLTEGAMVESLTLDAGRALVKTPTSVARWTVATGTREPLFSWAQDPKSLGVGVASPDGATLLVPGADWSMEIRRRDTAAKVTLRGHTQQISHIEFSRDNQHLYSSSHDGTIRRWVLATGASTVLLAGRQPVRGFAVAADGRVAAHVGDTLTMIAPDGTSRLVGQGDPWCALYALFEPVHDRLIMHRCRNSIAILDGDRLVELPTDGYPAGRISVSPDGTRVVGAMGDRTVRVWDARSGAVLHVLRGHTDLVMDAAISPDGTRVGSASYDKTVRVWQLASGQHRVLRGHAGPVDRVVWSGDGELVTGSRDGTLRVWTVPALATPSSEALVGRLVGATSARIDADRPATGTL